MNEDYDKWQDNTEAHEAIRLSLIALSERLERVENAVSTIMGIMDAKWDIIWYNGGDPQSLQQEDINGKNEEVFNGSEHDRVNSEED
ncbi:hypothetical protein CPTG_00200 [Cyanophage Syn2]|uniref:Uncharacterized protein n=1 Tax=Cyanophage Syn2 TaxID=536473 RepID=M4SP29_9CAUD|nr:hypothetical protein CPTG_00200 [Cyanophage Syn2]